VNLVDISFEGAVSEGASSAGGLTSAAESFALAALGRLGKEDWDLSILFCDDSFIRELNRQYRGKDEPTDVLSFEQGGRYVDAGGLERTLAGDIVVSLETLNRNVAEFAVPRGEELRRLVLHGMLHLLGLDHENSDPSQPMLILQERLLAEMGPGTGEFA